MTSAREEFLRRYATSPIHVPRLERLLCAYGDDEEAEAFSRRFIAWDCMCPDLEAARIVAEIISAGDESGRITRLSDDAVKGAIRWMSQATSLTVPERAECLRDVLRSRDEAAVRELMGFLEAAESLDDSRFRTLAESLANKLRASSRLLPQDD